MSGTSHDGFSTVVGFLEYQRATFAWKCSGLSAAGLNAAVGASTMTLGGMLKHLAYYEDHWFSHRMCGNDRQPVWRDDYWDADPDWDLNVTVEFDGESITLRQLGREMHGSRAVEPSDHERPPQS